jgi:hypothetical protein
VTLKRRPSKLKISNMIFRMGKLMLEPGDLVVLQTDLILDRNQAVTIKKRADEQFRPFRTIILTGGMKLGVLRKATKS